MSELKMIPILDIISLENKKNTYDPNRCNHTNVLLDESLGYIVCKKCGEHIDPLWYLKKLATTERNYEFKIQSLEEDEKKLNERIEVRKYVKCEHCGKMTKFIK